MKSDKGKTICLTCSLLIRIETRKRQEKKVAVRRVNQVQQRRNLFKKSLYSVLLKDTSPRKINFPTILLQLPKRNIRVMMLLSIILQWKNTKHQKWKEMLKFPLQLFVKLDHYLWMTIALRVSFNRRIKSISLHQNNSRMGINPKQTWKRMFLLTEPSMMILM